MLSNHTQTTAAHSSLVIYIKLCGKNPTSVTDPLNGYGSQFGAEALHSGSLQKFTPILAKTWTRRTPKQKRGFGVCQSKEMWSPNIADAEDNCSEVVRELVSSF